jgi:hypothetical protein
LIWQLVSNNQFSTQDMIAVFRKIGEESEAYIEKSLKLPDE